MGRLSIYKLNKYLPLILIRDGHDCLYCKRRIDGDFVYEHLDDEPSNNRIENIIIAHKNCNKEKEHNKEYKKMAIEKLEANMEANSHPGTKKQLQIYDKKLPTTASIEMRIAETNRMITRRYITEQLAVHDSIKYDDALRNCIYLCNEKNGTGSRQSIGNYIWVLTSAIGPFMVVKDGNGEDVIMKRTDDPLTGLKNITCRITEEIKT